MLERQSIWLDKDTIAALKRIGKQKERPVGWLIRKAVEEYVERNAEGDNRKTKGAK
jgi:predicted transcriptional regulator